MARICYSVAGEGRGHATRARTVIDELRQRGHRVTVLAPGFAWRMLEERYRNTDVRVQPIPGLMFRYRNQRVSLLHSVRGLGRYLGMLPRLVAKVRTTLRTHRCDLAITDFEPSLARAAAAEGLPWMSLDHQHFLSVSDFAGLPRRLVLPARLMGLCVERFYGGRPHEMVVSSFCFPPLRPAWNHVRQCGVLLRREIVQSLTTTEEHAVAYLRRFAPESVLAALRTADCEVRVYGVGRRPRVGNLIFCEISEDRFLEDLRTCRALISTAGNQLVGEALYLGKPILAIPEAGNFEQEINAHYLRLSGGGECAPLRELSPQHVHRILDDSRRYQCRIPRDRLNGNATAMRVVAGLLGETATSPAAALQEIAA